MRQTMPLRNVSALPTRTFDDYAKAVVDAARGLEDYSKSEQWRQIEKKKKLTMTYAVVHHDPAYGLRAAAFTTREEAAFFKAYLLQNEIHAVGVQEIVVHESALEAIEEPI